MNGLVADYPDQEIHAFLDNLNTHKPKIDHWLPKHLNVHFYYTPTDPLADVATQARLSAHGPPDPRVKRTPQWAPGAPCTGRCSPSTPPPIAVKSDAGHLLPVPDGAYRCAGNGPGGGGEPDIPAYRTGARGGSATWRASAPSPGPGSRTLSWSSGGIRRWTRPSRRFAKNSIGFVCRN